MAAVGLLLFSRGASAQGCPDTQSIDVRASVTTQLGRIFRDAIPSTCPSKAYPGLFNAGTTYFYTKRTYRHDGAAPACVTVTSTAQPTCVHLSAYQGTYDPAAQATGFLGDQGSSVPGAFSFTVAANSNFDIVAQETTTGGGTCIVDFTVTGCLSAVTIQPQGLTVAPLEAVSFTATGGAGHTFTLVSNQSGGSITAAGQYVAGPTGDTTDTVQVTNGAGATATTVVFVSGNLKISPPTGKVAPNGTLTFSASGGTRGYTFSIANNQSGGQINPTSGAYVAGPNGETVDTIRVTDAVGGTATALVSVAASVQLTPATVATFPGTTLNFTATGGTPPYLFALAVNASGGSIGAGQYTAGGKGAVVDVVRVTDATGLTATATVQVQAGLAVTPASASVPPRGTIQFTSTGGGADPSWSLGTNASGGSIDASGLYKAGSSANVVDVVKATLGSGVSVSVSVNVTAGVGLVPDSATVAPLGTIEFLASGGSKSFTFTLITNASGGSVDGAGLYKAGPKGNVVDELEVKDTAGSKRIATISVGAALSLSPASSTVNSGETIAFAIAGGSGSYSAKIEPNASGARVDAGGRYVAGSNAGQDTIIVTDSNGAIATAVVTVMPASTSGTSTSSSGNAASSSGGTSGGGTSGGGTSGGGTSGGSSSSSGTSAVNVGGTDGCSTTGPSGGNWLAFIAVAAALALSRRAKRRAD